MFTFIIISYNQEKLILETLESIKYQIEKYGNKQEYQIIIADDKSKDRTYEIEKVWIEKNKQLFKEISVLPSDMNRGINANYLRAFPMIQGEFYKVIAGDDLVADIDITALIKKKGIYITSFLFFNEKGIIRKKESYFNQYQFFGENLKKIKKVSQFIYPFYTQSWILFKEYNSPKMIHMMSRYKFMEDRPQWYRFMADGPVEIVFYNEPLVLYRTSVNSVSNFNNPLSREARKDLLKFYCDVIKEMKNPVKKMTLYCYKMEYWKNNMFLKLLNPFKYYIFIDRKIKKEKIDGLTNQLMEKYADKNSEYLKLIRKRASMEYEELIGY